MQLYMLDTNTASYIIKGEPATVRQHLISVPMASICISSITQAELLHGLAKKPEAIHLSKIVKEFLIRVQIIPWDSDAAEAYARLRAYCEREGTPLGTMDMLIAAHSVAIGAIIVTNDKAFHRIKKRLTIADWTIPINQ